MVIDKSTGQKILDAAKEVFVRKGADGARMQEIADEAGINKALLHYYFRSKEKLFEAVFIDAFRDFFPKAAGLLNSPLPILEKLPVFVNEYINVLRKNPHIPIFILHELSRDPDHMIKLVLSTGIKPSLILEQMKTEAQSGLIRYYPAEQLLVNILAMIIFPFAGRPIITGLIFNNESEKFDSFLNERAESVNAFIINALKP